MKKLISFVLCLILIVGTVPAAFADSAFSVTLTPDTENASVGDEVTFTVTVSGTPTSRSASLAVTVDEGLEIKTGAMTVSGAVMNSFDLSTNKGVSMLSSASSFDGQFATFTVSVLEEGPRTVKAEVKLNPSGSEATAEYTLNDTPVRKAVVTVANATADEGVVTVGVDLSEAPLVKSLAVSDVEYDADLFELTGADWTLDGATLARFDWDTGKGVAAFADEKDINGKVFELSFNVKDGAEEGEYPVSLTITLKDKSGAEIPVETLPGSVTIISVPVDPCAEGHDFGEWIVNVPATCTEPGSETRYCSRCDASETREIEASGHEYIGVVTAPTCTEQGYTTYTCANCGDSYVDSIVASHGHSFGEWEESVPSGCTAEGEEKRVCSACGFTESRAKGALGHDYVSDTVAPTCTERGYTVFTCSRCSESYITDYTDALGHSFGKWIETKAAGCTKGGEEKRTCSVCGESEIRPTGAKGHDYKSTVTAPTCTQRGFTTNKCSRCGNSYNTDYKDALGHDFGSDKNAEKCSRCGTKNPDYNPPIEFNDVQEGAYYVISVSWAVSSGVTAGTGAGKFSPDAGCTRGQVVTFLWRAVGEPAPKSSDNPFTDVSETDYYYNAVLWAVENGITAGTSKTTFSPSSTCTRGQIVTFLYRFKGSPAPKTANNPFGDVTPSDYFFSAVLWAVGDGITAGKSATSFAPSDVCTRAQVVTFLYRAMN